MAIIQSYQNYSPTLGKKTFLHETATIIGNVTIGDDVSVWPNAVIRGDVHHISIGNRTNLQDSVIVHATHDGPYNPGGISCRVGLDVTVGHRATLHACTIEDNVLIGIHCIVMDGTKVGKNVILGAGSLVPPNKVLDSGYLWLGSPAEKKRPLKPEEIEFLSYSAKHYIRLKNQYLSTS